MYDMSPNKKINVVLLTSVPQTSTPYCCLYDNLKNKYSELFNIILVGKIASLDILKENTGSIDIISNNRNEKKTDSNLSMFSQIKIKIKNIPGVLTLWQRFPRILRFSYLKIEYQREYQRSVKVNRRSKLKSFFLAPSLCIGSAFQQRLAKRVENARKDKFKYSPISPHECDILFQRGGGYQKLVSKIIAKEPHVLVQLGWGIINKHLLNIPCWGMLSWHHGVMPNLRGIYTPTWAVAHNRIDFFGITLQRLNEGIDTGKIVSIKSFDPKEVTNYVQAYLKLDEFSIKMTIDALKGLQEGKNIIIDENIDALSGEYHNVFGIIDIIKFLINKRSFFSNQSDSIT